jgi:hypothetical protein
MTKPKLIVIFLLSAVLLSSAFFSLANAQDEPEDLEPRVAPDEIQPDTSDSSPDSLTQDGNEILYSAEDDNSLTQEQPEQEITGAEDANLIAPNTNSENNLPLVIAAIVLAIVVSALAIFVGYTKFVKKKD